MDSTGTAGLCHQLGSAPSNYTKPTWFVTATEFEAMWIATMVTKLREVAESYRKNKTHQEEVNTRKEAPRQNNTEVYLAQIGSDGSLHLPVFGLVAPRSLHLHENQNSRSRTS